jgi:hypothetical protein
VEPPCRDRRHIRESDAAPAITSTASAPTTIQISPGDPPLVEAAATLELWAGPFFCEVAPAVVCPPPPWIVWEPTGYALVSCVGAVAYELDPSAATDEATGTTPALPSRQQIRTSRLSWVSRLT